MFFSCLVTFLQLGYTPFGNCLTGFCKRLSLSLWGRQLQYNYRNCNCILLWWMGAITQKRNTKYWKDTNNTHTATQCPTNNGFHNIKKHPLIAFVRTHPNLGVPVAQSHKFSRFLGRLPISRLYLFYQGQFGQETGLLSTRFRFHEWRTPILVISLRTKLQLQLLSSVDVIFIPAIFSINFFL